MKVSFSNHSFFLFIGKDGYLYGRGNYYIYVNFIIYNTINLKIYYLFVLLGVTDNKGPMLATIFDVSELQQEKKLKANVSFLIEGEEENGSSEFYNTVEQSKVKLLFRKFIHSL